MTVGQFDQNTHAVWNQAVTIQVDTVGEITRQLTLTMDRIDELIGAQPTDWQQWYLPRLRREVEQTLAAFGEGAGGTMVAGAAESWSKGVELVDLPLAEGPGDGVAGIRLDGIVPRLDRGQLLAMQHFLTSKMQGISLATANRINQELGLVVTGLNTPAAATAAIHDLLGGAVRRRAVTIVRTELGRAFSSAAQGRMEQAKKAGVSGLKKQWRRSGKLHSRRTHDLADGQIQEVDHPFLVGGEKIMYPRDPNASARNSVSCGCMQLPYMDHWTVTTKGEKPFSAAELAGSQGKRDIQSIRDSSARSGSDGPRTSGWQTAPRPVLDQKDAILRVQVLTAATADDAAGEYLAARNLVDGREWPPVTSGIRDRVEIPPDLRVVLADPAAQIAIHHDHPDATSFSRADLRLFDRFPGLQVVFAHGHDGTCYEARRIVGAELVTEVEMLARKAVEEMLVRAVSQGRLWPRESAEFRRHAINAAMAQAGVMNYSVHWSLGAEKRWNDAKAVIEDVIHAGSKAATQR